VIEKTRKFYVGKKGARIEATVNDQGVVLLKQKTAAGEELVFTTIADMETAAALARLFMMGIGELKKGKVSHGS
jgi:hypothetical protein